MSPNAFAKQHAFTLIELAIVLVIIGLLVGGVLVGQDLVKSASISGQMNQLEQFNQGALTFRDKYQAIPGDISSTKAAQFGFTSNVSPVLGDNLIGLQVYINPDGPGPGSYLYENIAFWINLSEAALIPGSYTGNPNVGPLVTSSDMMPTARIRDKTYIDVTSWQGRNYFAIMKVTGFGVISPISGISNQAGLSRTEAESIDRKLDDDLPQTGSVLSINFDNYGGIANTSSTDISGTYICSGTAYFTTASASIIACELGVRANF